MPEPAAPPTKPVEGQVQANPNATKGWMANLPALGTNVPTSAPPAEPPAPVVPPIATPPEPPPAVPPAEPPPVESEEDKFPRTSADWKKFRENRKAKETELSGKIDAVTKERDELNTKLKGLTSFQDTPEYKAMVKERDDLSEKLRILDVTQHPKFVAYFDSKTKAQVELAKRIVGNDKADAVAKLLSMPDSDYRTEQIREFVQELDVLDQSRLGGVLNALTGIDAERSAAINEAKTSGDAIREREKAQADNMRSQQQKQQEAFIEAQIKAITDPTKGNPVFQKRDKDDAWNAAVDKRLESVKTLLMGKITQQDIFNTAANGVAYHQVVADYKAVQEENTKLKAQVAELTAAQPKLDGAAGAKPADGEPTTKIEVKRGANPMETSGAWAKAMREAMTQQ